MVDVAAVNMFVARQLVSFYCIESKQRKITNLVCVIESHTFRVQIAFFKFILFHQAFLTYDMLNQFQASHKTHVLTRLWVLVTTSIFGYIVRNVALKLVNLV